MPTKQLIALYTLVRREIVRMFRIASQVFPPPVITTGLYFLIFGTVIGRRIGTIEGFDYVLFISPGLIMMAVITNAYGNVSTSLFSMRFQKSIEEILISPIHDGLLLLGYVLGGIIRGLLVALLIFIISSFFVHLEFNHLPLTILVVFLVSALFSLAGFTNAIVARNFDDVMLIPTFVLTPLTYLGGIFYSVNMLPPFWQTVSKCNPIFYMISAMRHAMIGQASTNMAFSMTIICFILILLVALNLFLIKKGTGLRD